MLNFGAAGGSGSVASHGENLCSWQATTNAGWIQIVSAPQNCDGIVTINVSRMQRNVAKRNRALGARTFTVNQPDSGRRFDFDGDGKADVSVFRPSLGAGTC